MEKYLAILDRRTLALIVVSLVVTHLCFRFGFAYDLNITLFSIAVVFPLVFTIREAFKRRDSALKFLSLFKASMMSVHYCFEQCKKLSPEQLDEVAQQLALVSTLFKRALNSERHDNRVAEEALNEVFYFIRKNNDAISSGLALKMIRFLQDVNESMENTISLKMHGTPISMRAYCLVFVYVFPCVFAPTVIYHLPDAPVAITYGLSVLHGFVLISLYNVQTAMENPFDQVGLDDIQIDEYSFRRVKPRDPSDAPPAKKVTEVAEETQAAISQTPGQTPTQTPGQTPGQAPTQAPENEGSTQ